jgi:hypothetical protein
MKKFLGISVMLLALLATGCSTAFKVDSPSLLVQEDWQGEHYEIWSSDKSYDDLMADNAHHQLENQVGNVPSYKYEYHRAYILKTAKETFYVYGIKMSEVFPNETSLGYRYAWKIK